MIENRETNGCFVENEVSIIKSEQKDTGKFYTKGKVPTAIQNLWKEVIGWIQNSEYEITSNYDFECYSESDSDSDDI